MRVGILGSGAVGQALAVGFIKEKHEVKIGTRDPGKIKGVAAGTPKDVAQFAELAVLVMFRSKHEDGEYRVYTVWADGSKLARRTQGPGGHEAPVWLLR